MNTDWVSSAQFTAPDSPLGKKEAEPAALKLRHACHEIDQLNINQSFEHNELQMISRRIHFNFKRDRVLNAFYIYIYHNYICGHIVDNVDRVLEGCTFFPFLPLHPIAHHCRFESPVQLWELNRTDRSNTVDQAVRADGCSQHCVHDHSVDPCECFEQLHLFLIRQTWNYQTDRGVDPCEWFKQLHMFLIRQTWNHQTGGVVKGLQTSRWALHVALFNCWRICRCLYLFRCSPLVLFAFTPS